MKTPDEIKKGLFVCSDFEGNCPYCPYAVNGHRDPEGMCVKQLANDADILIRQLEADVKIGQIKLEAAFAKCSQLVAERDAAIADIRLAYESYVGRCETCKHVERQVDCDEPEACGLCRVEDCPCRSCGKDDRNWEWRGVQKEEIEE